MEYPSFQLSKTTVLSADVNCSMTSLMQTDLKIIFSSVQTSFVRLTLQNIFMCFSSFLTSSIRKYACWHSSSLCFHLLIYLAFFSDCYLAVSLFSCLHISM